MSAGDPEAAPGEFRRFLDALPAAAYTCNAEGLITCFNQRASELWGSAPASNTSSERYCGSLRLFDRDGNPIPHQGCWVGLALQAGEDYQGRELLIERGDGSRLTVLANANPLRDSSGGIAGAIHVLIDISDRRRAEDALLASQVERDSQLLDLTRLNEMNTRLSATRELGPILQAVLHAACAIDRTDMGLLALCESVGGPLQTAASMGLEAGTLRRIEAVRGCTGACVMAFAERRRVVFEDVQSAPCSEGYREAAREAGFRAVHSTPLITRAGRIVGVLSTHARTARRPSPWQMHLLDVCARQAADVIENAWLYSQINEQQRRKDEFLAVLAHELRNPLAPIRNAVQVMQSPSVEESHRVWATRIIDRQVRHMARLVDDLLDLQRLNAGKLELRKVPTDASAVVDAALEASRPLIESRGQHLSVQMPPEPIQLDADLTRLAQVIADLLDNAAKFTPHGGSIAVATERRGEDVLICVKDTGIGIPAEQLSRIFQMFAQSEPVAPHVDGEYSHAGLGVGLTLAKQLVELHGGAITAHSEGVNRGSEFVVRLPALSRAAASRYDVNVSAPASPAGLRILIVDDNRDSASSLALMLRLMGNEVRTGHDGREAVTLAEAFHPDAVLLDIGLPVISGHEAARQIRASAWGRACTLIAITGWGQDSDRTRSLEAGLDHHLVKPVDVGRLLEILNTVRPQPPAPHAGGEKRKRRHARAGETQSGAHPSAAERKRATTRGVS
jgi:signal transduction histidine kinase/DNA-binding NarL/FixJ family response regulator